MSNSRSLSFPLSAPLSFPLTLGEQAGPPPNLWTPDQISTQAWYDAADPLTITESGGAVSQWDDKSGNDRHVLQGNGAFQPVYNLSDAVDFNGSTHWLGNLNPFMWDNGELSVFVISRPTQINANLIYVSEGNTANSVPTYVPARFLSSQLGVSIRAQGGPGFLINDTLGVAPLLNTRHLSYWKDEGDQFTARLNAADEPLAEPYARAGFLTLDNFTLGAVRVGAAIARHIRGEVNEIVICNNLSNADRQRMEGYLAWKWGIQSDLPVDHPYSSAPPTLPSLWTPADIETSAWFDASDGSTITEAGGSVSQWDDKSGNIKHATQATANDQPTVIPAGINGLDVLEFANRTQDMDGVSNIDAMWVAVVLQYNSVPQFTQALGSQNSAGGENYTVQYRGDLNPDRWQNAYFTNGNPETIWGAAVNVNPTIVIRDGMSLTNFPFQIGGDRGINNRGWDGYIAEIIYGNQALDEMTRQRVEGYLAHKWGTTDSLPALHPYKSSPPTV